MPNPTTATGKTLSLWNDEVPPTPRAPLATDTKADVCVVGAGIAGLTTAYALLKEGLSVVVLDAASVGSGQTGGTTAHVSSCLEERYQKLAQYHGAEAVKAIFDSHTFAIEQIEAIITAEKIECDWKRVSGYLFRSPTEKEDILSEEYRVLSNADVKTIELLDRAPLSAFDTGLCLHFPFQGSFHATKYIRGLAAVIERLGGKIYSNTHVEKIEKGSPPASVVSKDGLKVTAGSVVVATNSPINDFAVIHTKQAPYRTYAIAAEIPKGSVERGLYWDTHDPYHYVRIEETGEKDLLIVGGEDHKTGQASHPEDSFVRLEHWAKEHFPMIEAIRYRWSGQCMESVDGLAFLGRNPADRDNIYVITGDSGNGITHGTLGGYLIKDLITGRPNPWSKLYSPSRIRASSASHFIQENLNSVSQYLDWVTPADAKNDEEIEPGEGAILREGLSRVAAFKDERGNVHRCSAVCPHLGAIVSWNRVEKTWDCPCHGSRFSPEGEVIEGPATSNLSPHSTSSGLTGTELPNLSG